MRRFAAGILAGAVASFVGLSARAQDTVTLRDDTEIKGKITSLDSKGLTISPAKSGEQPRTLTLDEFKNFILGDRPPSLMKANQAANDNKMDKANDLFKAALDEIAGGKARPIHKEFVYKDWAMAYKRKGEVDNALDTLKTLRKECGDCYSRRESYALSMELAKKKGEEAFLKVLEEMATDMQPFGGEGRLEIAKLKYEKKDYKGAKESFWGLANDKDQPYVSEARLWHIRCLRALSLTDELKTVCTEVLANRTGASLALLQAAGAGLGDALMKEAEKDKSKRRDALLAYAQAISIGPPARDDNSEDYELALYNAGRIYVTLSSEAAKPDVQADYKGRATLYFQELKNAYKSSSYGQLAAKELQALGVGEKSKDSKKP